MKLKVNVKPKVTEMSLKSAEKKEPIKEVLTESAFDKVVKRARDIQEDCVDYVSKPYNMEYCLDSDSPLGQLYDNKEDYESNLTPYSFSQLCNKVGVPTSYLQKCVDKAHDEKGKFPVNFRNLTEDTLNQWIAEYGKPLLIRTYESNVRGILTPKFSILDTPDVLDAVSASLNMNDYNVKGSFLSEERMHLRLISKDTLSVPDEDDLHAGIFIDSSDVGRSTLTVHFGIYKQICTNGLMISKSDGVLFKQKHIGITKDEFYQGLVASLKDYEILVANSEYFIELAMKDHETFSLRNFGEDDYKRFAERIREQVNISEEKALKVIDLMQTRYGDTRWGYINSLTEVAQDFTLEKRLEIEKIAGNLLVA